MTHKRQFEVMAAWYGQNFETINLYWEMQLAEFYEQKKDVSDVHLYEFAISIFEDLLNDPQEPYTLEDMSLFHFIAVFMKYEAIMYMKKFKRRGKKAPFDEVFPYAIKKAFEYHQEHGWRQFKFHVIKTIFPKLKKILK